MRWQAECYHYEYTDEADMNAEHGIQSSRIHSKQRVVTGHDKETFHFTSWRDYTRDIKDLIRKPVIQVKTSIPHCSLTWVKMVTDCMRYAMPQRLLTY